MVPRSSVLLYDSSIGLKQKRLVIFFDPKAGTMIVCLSVLRASVVLAYSEIYVDFTSLQHVNKCFVVKSRNLVCFYKLKLLAGSGSSGFGFCIYKLILILFLKCFF